jgi:hypothetical protein
MRSSLLWAYAHNPNDHEIEANEEKSAADEVSRRLHKGDKRWKPRKRAAQTYSGPLWWRGALARVRER